jgi:hypothetical protein
MPRLEVIVNPEPSADDLGLRVLPLFREVKKIQLLGEYHPLVEVASPRRQRAGRAG